MKNLLIHAYGSAPDLIRAALRSATNADHAFDHTAIIHVVAQGPLVAHLRASSDMAVQIAAALNNPQIRVHACGNSMVSADMDSGDLIPAVGVVPSAVAFLAQMQWEGSAYVAL